MPHHVLPKIFPRQCRGSVLSLHSCVEGPCFAAKLSCVLHIQTCLVHLYGAFKTRNGVMILKIFTKTVNEMKLACS